MKRFNHLLLFVAVALTGLLATAQVRTLEIYQNGVLSQSFPVATVDSVKIGQALESPLYLNASLSGDYVNLEWGKVTGATSYEIYRSGDNTTYTTLATDITGTTYTDRAPLTGLNYYKVKAVSDEMSSALSSASSPVSFGGASIEQGLYMGIIGFNADIYSKEIGVLATNTQSQFTGFVSSLSSQNGTILYYSVDKAIDKLMATPLPNDLVNVSVITFTDGLDKGSVAMDDARYYTNAEYLAAVNNRIKNDKVQGCSITAYSIGLKGNDVSDNEQFMANLQSLASSPENATEVSSMEEVNAKFQEIASQLYLINSSQTVSLKIPGEENGTRVRFTFDQVSDASQSTLYIEGTFSLQDRSLKNVHYEGFTCGSGSTVAGTKEGIFFTFSFVDLRQDSGEEVSTTHIKQWNYIESSALWQINSEFAPDENTVTTVERKSAAIMLVLDCSSSLGTQFASLQSHAKQFIETMAANTEPSTGGNSSVTPGSNFDLFTSLSNDEMVYVEGGTFWMGAQSSSSSSPNYDSEAYSSESPVHAVTLSSFYMGQYEVTQQLWEYVMNYSGQAADGTTMSAVGSDPWLGTNPSSSYGVGDNYPAYYVSYNDIVDYFLPRLNKITGKSYRLPTEAEWEYAARGGQEDEYTRTQGTSGTYYKYSGSNTLDNVAWYGSNSSSKTHPVGTKQANALGLYDMSGNVWELCSDWYGSYSSTSVTNPTGPTSGSYRVHRGGGWGSGAVYCRVSYRYGNAPSNRYGDLGFRLALSL